MDKVSLILLRIDSGKEGANCGNSGRGVAVIYAKRFRQYSGKLAD